MTTNKNVPNIIPLNAANMPSLADRASIPAYNRTRLRHHIVHIGVGGFHRAHQAVYLDDLLLTSPGDAWSICGIGLLPQDRRISEVLKNQDFLYTVIERDITGDKPRIIGSITGFVLAPEDPEAALNKMASSECRIISLTITEGGYYVSGDGTFNKNHPDIVRELEHPDKPASVFGYLAEAIRLRRKNGAGPVTLMSCDNLQSNGDVFKEMFLSFLSMKDHELRMWTEENCTFPNSMVDRITPATKDEHRDLLRDRFGIEDGWPVVTEPFRQWIVEDHFAAGRPAWETVGARMTSNVLPYEKMKIRLLNASHQALCYIGMLLGYRFAHQTMEDQNIRTLVRSLMDNEVTPLLPKVPGIDLEAYKDTLIERFANPTIGDQLTRIGTEGSARIPKFVLPSIVEQLRQGGPIRLLSFTVASWMRYLSGADDDGKPLAINDPYEARLRELAARGKSDPRSLLAMREVFDPDLANNPRFVREVMDALQSFREQGASATLARYAHAT